MFNLPTVLEVWSMSLFLGIKLQLTIAFGLLKIKLLIKVELLII